MNNILTTIGYVTKKSVREQEARTAELVDEAERAAEQFGRLIRQVVDTMRERPADDRPRR